MAMELLDEGLITWYRNFLEDVDKLKLLKYLKSGKFVEAYRHRYQDRINLLTFDSFKIYTDGEWEWSNELLYHVEKYNYPISKEFRAHMEKNDWQVPRKFRERNNPSVVGEMKIFGSKNLNKDISDIWGDN